VPTRPAPPPPPQRQQVDDERLRDQRDGFEDVPLDNGPQEERPRPQGYHPLLSIGLIALALTGANGDQTIPPRVSFIAVPSSKELINTLKYLFIRISPAQTVAGSRG
jgi:hypothetical protein